EQAARNHGRPRRADADRRKRLLVPFANDAGFRCCERRRRQRQQQCNCSLACVHWFPHQVSAVGASGSAPASQRLAVAHGAFTVYREIAASAVTAGIPLSPPRCRRRPRYRSASLSTPSIMTVRAPPRTIGLLFSIELHMPGDSQPARLVLRTAKPADIPAIVALSERVYS